MILFFVVVGLGLGEDLCVQPGDVFDVGGVELHVGDLAGFGTFGKVYRGQYGSKLVAVKTEKEPNTEGDMVHEYLMMELMQTSVGFPKVFAKDFTRACKFYVMEFLGVSLKYLHRNRLEWDIAILAPIALEMLACIETLHTKGYIMRDVHAGNFMLFEGRVYAIDLALAVEISDTFSRKDDLGGWWNVLHDFLNPEFASHMDDVVWRTLMIPSYEYIVELRPNAVPDYALLKCLFVPFISPPAV